MTNLQAIILGILQGLGEFLPISSSAHLALAPTAFGWEYQGLAYDVMLHGGTLLAVLIYFAKDWYAICKEAFLPLFQNKSCCIFSAIKNSVKKDAQHSGMLWLIILATIPAALAGVLLNDMAESTFRDIRLMAANLIIFSAFILWSDYTAKQEKTEKNLNVKHALLIGLAQCLALMPGASRSGMTIMAALFLGYKRPAAARFSFLLSTPVIGGAALFKAMKFSAADINLPFILGIISSFLTGLLVISFFMQWLKKHGLIPFLIYRVLLGLAILTFIFKQTLID